jgi:uncharacterized Zn finger protein (UPF0148 family)
VKTPEVETTNEAADFEAGFSAVVDGAKAEEPKVVEKEQPKESEAEVEAPKEQAEAAADDQKKTVDEAEKPGGLPLSAFDEEAIKTLLAKSAKVDELEMALTRQAQELRRAYGKIGELNSHLRQLMKAPTKRGIKQAELKFARLEEEYPELAQALKEDLAQVLGAAQEEVEQKEEPQEAKAGEPSEAAATEQMADMPQTSEELLQQRELQLRMEYEKKLLASRHPDWEQIAQTPDFRIWLASQPPEIQQVAMTSYSAEELSGVFDLYKQARQLLETKVRQGATKQKRLETAVPVSSSSTAAPPVSDELDDFLAGFNAVMKQRIY